MDSDNPLDLAAYLAGVLAIDAARRAGEPPPRWAVLVSREWAEQPEPEPE